MIALNARGVRLGFAMDGPHWDAKQCSRARSRESERRRQGDHGRASFRVNIPMRNRNSVRIMVEVEAHEGWTFAQPLQLERRLAHGQETADAVWATLEC